MTRTDWRGLVITAGFFGGLGYALIGIALAQPITCLLGILVAVGAFAVHVLSEPP